MVTPAMERSMQYAEKVNYWKTGKSSPDVWLEKAKKEIRAVGGELKASLSIDEGDSGRAAFCLAFVLEDELYRIKWPVLQSKTKDVHAAKRQAATALYYDVKAKCVMLKFLGAHAAFLPYLELPNGQTAAEAASAFLVDALPKLLVAGPGVAL